MKVLNRGIAAMMILTIAFALLQTPVLAGDQPKAPPAPEKVAVTPPEQEQLSRLMLGVMQAQAQYQQVLSSPQFRALERQVQDAAAALEAEIAKLRQKFGKDAACTITFEKTWRCPPPPPPPPTPKK